MDYAQTLELAALSKQQPMLEAMAAGESEVQRFYKKCTVFVTGGSGFLGKQLIEKLLRSCNLSKVYMLVRPKKNKHPNERIKEMITNASAMDYAQELEAAGLEKQQPMLAALAAGEGEVQRFYKNCTVFVTGGSGFLGKQLLEKLLRTCKLSKVYMLIRAKKGKGIQERIKEVVQDPVFDSLHKKQPRFYEKIIAVEGDISEINLGIKDKDWEKLTKEVDIIFHLAATTRFDESLKVATLINVRGTREALNLGKSCKKLKSYVHVSTAYSHATSSLVGGDVEEEFYNSPVPPDTMISMAETMEVSRLNGFTKELIKGWPNTYTFTKAIAEEQIRLTSAGLPICIVRPAIVMSTYLEPTPGWLDKSCLYGVTGLIFGGGMGVVHTSLTKDDIAFGFIPCDYVNNACIVAARETASNQAKGGDHTKIYTVCSTHRNPVTFRVFADTMRSEGLKIASPKMVYYSFNHFTTNKLVFYSIWLLLHVIPAYVADFVCLLMGKERRFVKLITKLHSMFDVISFFSLNTWNFVDNNVSRLYSSLSKQDQAIFNFDVTNIIWPEFLMHILIGLRKYILKDELKDTEYGIKKQKYLKIFHYAFMVVYLFCLWKLVSLAFFAGSTLVSSVFNLLY